MFIPRKSRNISVKTVLFYLERFQRDGVLQMYNFLGHPAVKLTEYKSVHRLRST